MGSSREPTALQRSAATGPVAADREVDPAIRRTDLPGGLRILTEAMPGVRSAAFGIWVGVGSRDEEPGLAGASHYLEHLLFKGTARRSALDIAASVDAVGGELNAFTTKESTCYYAHVLDTDLPMAVDLVSDVVLNATIAAADVDSERGVILEEIAMRDDDPGDYVHDLFGETLFGDHPLGRPVLGTVESIESISRDQVAGYYRDRYRQPLIVVAAAGQVDHDSVVELVSVAFADRLGGSALPAPPRAGDATGPAPVGRVSLLRRDTEQAHLVLGGTGLARSDERRFALAVLNNALGGGMSSRLFQEIREKRGLAYSVYSFTSQYAGAGSFGVYAGVQPSNAHQAVALMREQLADIADHGLSDTEVTRGKGQAKGGLVLGLEDASSRMSRIGKAELVHGEVLTVDELLARVDAVTPDDVREVAADLLTRPRCLTVIGPFAESDFDGEL